VDNRFECVPCAICGQQNAELLMKGSGPACVVRCRNDGLLYQSPRPKAAIIREKLKTFVRPDNLELFSGYRRAMLRREARAIQQLKPGGSLLDIGCATGTLFEFFQGSGWRLHGVDTSQTGVELAARQYRAEVFCGTLQEARYPCRSFDVVSILDTLFYDPQPDRELLDIRRLLKDDGLLALEIPGHTYRMMRERGPLCWLLNRRWVRGFANSGHLYFFSPHTIRLLLANAGFHVVRVVPEQASMSMGNWGLVLNHLHFAAARLLFGLTAGRLSIAGKELYLAVKAAADGDADGS